MKKVKKFFISLLVILLYAQNTYGAQAEIYTETPQTGFIKVVVFAFLTLI